MNVLLLLEQGGVLGGQGRLDQQTLVSACGEPGRIRLRPAEVLHLLVDLPLHDRQPDPVGGVPILHGNAVQVPDPPRVVRDDVLLLLGTQGRPPVVDLVGRPGGVRLLLPCVDHVGPRPEGRVVQAGDIVVDALQEHHRVLDLLHQAIDLLLVGGKD